MAQRILRLTRHAASEIQLCELRRIFGDDCEVIDVRKKNIRANLVRELVDKYQATILEVVLPLSILSEVINPQTGVSVPVIRAVMKRELPAKGPAIFTFLRYEKVVTVEIRTEPL